MAYRIKEGNKERIQQYRGVVIRISGDGDKKRFTVRKMSDNIGVERIFPIESPFIDSITVNKYGKVRRAKLYYLRGLTSARRPASRSAASTLRNKLQHRQKASGQSGDLSLDCPAFLCFISLRTLLQLRER